MAQETLIPDWFKFTCFHTPECTFKSTFLLAAHGEMPANLLLIQLFFANLAAFRHRSVSRVISQQVRHDVAMPMGYGQIQRGGTGVRLILEANVLG